MDVKKAMASMRKAAENYGRHFNKSEFMDEYGGMDGTARMMAHVYFHMFLLRKARWDGEESAESEHRSKLDTIRMMAMVFDQADAYEAAAQWGSDDYQRGCSDTCPMMEWAALGVKYDNIMAA